MNVVWRSLEFGICIDSDSVIHEISINLLAELFGDRSRDRPSVCTRRSLIFSHC
jgi:hypothetical protein